MQQALTALLLIAVGDEIVTACLLPNCMQDQWNASEVGLWSIKRLGLCEEDAHELQRQVTGTVVCMLIVFRLFLSSLALSLPNVTCSNRLAAL